MFHPMQVRFPDELDRQLRLAYERSRLAAVEAGQRPISYNSWLLDLLKRGLEAV